MSDFESITWQNQEKRRREERCRRWDAHAKQLEQQRRKEQERQQIMAQVIRILYTCAGACVGALGCCAGNWIATGSQKMPPAMMLFSTCAVGFLAFALHWDKE